jgi:Spy/CpxP family protein refolding chaperone
MRSRTFSLSVLSAGLFLGGFMLPARAEDQPKEPPTTQNGGPASPEARRGFPMLDRFRAAVSELKLSDEQKGKIDTMFEDAQSQLKKIREGASGERQELLKKTMEVFGKLRKDVAGVLDDDQKEKLKGKFEKLFQRGGAAGGDMVGRLKAAIEKLNLTDEQKTKIHDLLEEAGKKAKDLRAQAENGGTEARDKLRDLLTETREKIGVILTEEQKQKLQESLQQGGGAGAKLQSTKPNE